MGSPAFPAELKSWIRFSRSEAVAAGDGLFSGTIGNPSLPRWLGLLMFGLLASGKSESDKYARPEMVIRFGRGPQMPQSLRRPVAAILT
jgi:hypothetical protein